MQILKGHISPATAYVVDDYPYGYTLRCKIRYWLEYKYMHGVRLVSQTTNPKRPGEVWNKPKASTYCRFAGCMYLDDVGHVQWSGLSEYCTGAEGKAWLDTYRDGVPDAALELATRFVNAKLAYDAKRNGDHSLPLSEISEARDCRPWPLSRSDWSLDHSKRTFGHCLQRAQAALAAEQRVNEPAR